MANDYSGNTRADLVATTPADTDSIGEVGAALRQVKRVLTNDDGIMREINDIIASTLSQANAYTDTKDSETLAAAKDYTNSQVNSARSYRYIVEARHQNAVNTNYKTGSLTKSEGNFNYLVSETAELGPSNTKYVSFTANGFEIKAGTYIVNNFEMFGTLRNTWVTVTNFFDSRRLISSYPSGDLYNNLFGPTDYRTYNREYPYTGERVNDADYPIRYFFWTPPSFTLSTDITQVISFTMGSTANQAMLGFKLDLTRIS